MQPLRDRTVGFPEAVGLSLAIVAPTMAMSFNVTLAVDVAGAAAPMAFIAGTVVMALVGLVFLWFSRRNIGEGSVPAMIAGTLGKPAGFTACWALLLTYLCFGSGTAVLAGSFLQAALLALQVPAADSWLVLGVAAILVSLVLSLRGLQLAGRLMLALEVISMLVIVWLGWRVLCNPSGESSLGAPDLLPESVSGWEGVGSALVFAVLSFAGFEGATTIARETRDPRRTIPLALLGSLGLAGIFYTFTAYFQIAGFGSTHLAELAKDPTPLSTLASRQGSPTLGIMLDLAASMSAFACVLGSMNAAARMGQTVHWQLRRRTNAGFPAPAVTTPALAAVAVAMGSGVATWGAQVGPGAYYGAIGTIGTLALILVYLALCTAGTRDMVRQGRPGLAACGVAAIAGLAWPLWASTGSGNDGPAASWPYLVVGWLVIGWGLSSRSKPT
ncbi:MAG: APC family permease [Gammaproteobacteria bacterium]